MKVVGKISVPVKSNSQIPTRQSAALGDIVFGVNGDKQVVTLQTGAALTFFREMALNRPRLVDNAVGLYSHGSIGKLGKVKWNIIGSPKHVWQPRTEGCAWNPKSHIPMEGDQILAKGIELDMEMCDKDLLDDCTRQLFGTGTDINNLNSTEEGKKLIELFMQAIYQGKGDSLYDLLEFGDHPLIWAAQTSGTYGISADEFADYIDQMQILGGWMTSIDYQKSIGHPQYTVPIDTATEVNGELYIGDTFALFNRVRNKASVKMKSLINKSRMSGKPGIYLVSPSIFNKYEQDLIAADALNAAQVTMNGIFLDGNVVPGVLKFNGDYVLSRDSWAEFDQIVQVHTHRVLYVVPGVFGFAYDIPKLDQYGPDQAGLIVEKSTSVKDKFKTYIFGEMEIGAGLLSKDYIVNASVSVPF